jgi:hypothetical protein
MKSGRGVRVKKPVYANCVHETMRTIAHGSGTYTISLPEGVGKPGTMTGGGEGYAAGYKGTGTEKYTLTPIAPCK